jgi:hypothetical protein
MASFPQKKKKLFRVRWGALKGPTRTCNRHITERVMHGDDYELAHVIRETGRVTFL